MYLKAACLYRASAGNVGVSPGLPKLVLVACALLAKQVPMGFSLRDVDTG
jgi:hypothetical protein